VDEVELVLLHGHARVLGLLLLGEGEQLAHVHELLPQAQLLGDALELLLPPLVPVVVGRQHQPPALVLAQVVFVVVRVVYRQQIVRRRQQQRNALALIPARHPRDDDAVRRAHDTRHTPHATRHTP